MKIDIYSSWPDKLAGLRKLARAGAIDVKFRKKIYQIAKEGGFKNLNIETEEFLDYIFGERFIYCDDPTIEFYHEPVYFLDAMLGDCDDAALLTATICELLSVPWRFVLVKVNGKIGHIFTQAKIKGKIIKFDFTLPSQRFNVKGE